jgi:hypothetical protein
MTLFELLNSFNDVIKFDLLKKLTICSTSSTSLADRLNADIEEFYISEIPLRLLRKKVIKVYHYENTIVVFKKE